MTTIAEDSDLLQWWSADNERNPEEVDTRDYKRAFWTCPKGHSFERSPRAMTASADCPICKVSGTSFAAVHPKLAIAWHPSLNEGLLPQDIPADRTDPCWWLCEHGHAFERSPLELAQNPNCPTCNATNISLATLYPSVARFWHPDKNTGLSPETIPADHRANVWWKCDKGHEFQRAVRNMTINGGQCPVCYSGWSLERVKAFVRSLQGHLSALNPSEIFTLAMQAGAFDSGTAYQFALEVSSGWFPEEELEKFLEDEPSLVDQYATNPDFTLVQEVHVERDAQPEEPYALPYNFEQQGSGPRATIDAQVLDQQSEVESEAESSSDSGEASLPIIETSDALRALTTFSANADVETVRFLCDSALAKLWRHAFEDPEQAKSQAEAFRGDEYSDLVRDTFLDQLKQARELTLPRGYAFRPVPSAPIAEPLLMQRHVAVRVRKERCFGNWSGMGAGKTLSAVLSTRVVDAQMTVVCCPNSVVENWASEIQNAFPDAQVQTKTWTPQWDALSDNPRYLVLNYECFQQNDSEAQLLAFLAANRVDFLIIDEIHFAKQRSSTQMSRRKRLVQALRLEADKQLAVSDGRLYVLGMSGTPVINELQEGRSLVELITGYIHHDLETRPTVQNCMRLYQKLVTLGTRYMPAYEMALDESARPEVDCSEYLDQIRALAVAGASPAALEQVLTQARIPAIVEHLAVGKKTLIYTHYIDGIVGPLRAAIEAEGFVVGTYTGKTDDHDLKDFMSPKGRTSVLIASSRISTGVDGLQRVCDTLIINVLPWTRAEYDQLRGRLWRQGSVFDKITVVIPITYADLPSGRWSYCESKLQRLAYKKSIADAAVDGIVPAGELRTPAQAQRDIMAWLARLEEGNDAFISRSRLVIPLSSDPVEVERRRSSYGDFTHMNNRWYASSSQTTHKRLQDNPEEWAHYHTMYRKLRESWDVVPYEEEIEWLAARSTHVVGDFGCGEALIQEAMGEIHTIHSFDHVAIHEGVTACDIANVGLADDTLDLAIFCLSLMGSNITDYLLEARRCLKLDGRLHIWEPKGRMKDPEEFCRNLERLGFEVPSHVIKGQFVRIYTSKNARSVQEGTTLELGGSQ